MKFNNKKEKSSAKLFLTQSAVAEDFLARNSDDNARGKALVMHCLAGRNDTSGCAPQTSHQMDPYTNWKAKQSLLSKNHTYPTNAEPATIMGNDNMQQDNLCRLRTQVGTTKQTKLQLGDAGNISECAKQ